MAKQPNQQPLHARLIIFLWLLITPRKRFFKINLENYRDGYRLVHYGGNIYGLYEEIGATTYNSFPFEC